MIERSLLEKLHLSPDFIGRDHKTCKALASAYEMSTAKHPVKERMKGEINMGRAISATLYRRSAAHALLLGDYVEARGLFAKTALAYHDLGTPYALAIKAFSPTPLDAWEDEIEYWINIKDADDYQPHMIYLLLYYSVTRQDYKEELSHDNFQKARKNLEAFRAHHIGILGFSIGHYLDLVDVFGEDSSRTIDEAIFPFIAGYNSAIRRAINNKYHWRGLSMPFHPVEPDVFSILLIVDRAMKARQQGSILETIEGLPLSWESIALLEGILSDYDKGYDNKIIIEPPPPPPPPYYYSP